MQEFSMTDIPVIHVQARTLAETYETALTDLYRMGIRIRTQYDRPGDPPSIDATMNMTVLEPLSDPMIHKAFPGGIEDLREYVMELSGAKDHWMKSMNDPDDTRWEYTYHWRLQNYGTWKQRSPDSGKQEVAGPFTVDQIDAVVQKLAQEPYTRQAQMITWMPNIDLNCYDPPCLQSLHYRAVEDDSGTWYLNCNVRFRSNDAWGANFMNMFGFVQFNKAEIAERLSERTGKRVQLGRMNWHADSYHIYGKDVDEFQKRLLSRIDEPFEKRVFNFYDPMIQEIYAEAEKKVLQKIDEYDSKHREL
jgi:thymidylate synthase